MLPASIADRLELAYANEDHYNVDSNLAAKLQDKALIMLVGPVAVGKTSLIKKVIEHGDEFGYVVSFTTRGHRADDDPAMFHYYNHDAKDLDMLLTAIEQGLAVQYAVHPITKRLYGSFINGHASRYNLLATLANSVDGMQKLGFGRTVTIVLATDPATWKSWLATRYAHPTDDEKNRLKEAKLSLQWALARDVIWLDNTPGKLDDVADSLIKIVDGSLKSDDIARRHATEMLQILENTL